MIKGARGLWAAAVLTGSAVLLTSGCAAPVDPDELPGVYRDDETGGEIRLDSDMTFSATDVSTDGQSEPADFSGEWEYVDSETSSDFVYLLIDERGIGEVAGVQLYTDGQEAVYFRADPDGPPNLVLTKVAAPSVPRTGAGA